mgnify:FL=1
MNFLKILRELKNSYGENVAYTDNGVCLLGPCPDARMAEHFIFAPMSHELVQHLVQSYRRSIPEDLLTLYTAANGMELFRTMCAIPGGFKLPTSKLSVFGVPLLADRQHLAPYNISIEDLSRLPNTPEKWLKFGTRCKMDGEITLGEYDLYADTDSGTVYQSERTGKTLQISAQWESVDACLCSLFREEK